MTTQRLAPGAYLVDGRWAINRTREGSIHAHGIAWYWRDRNTGETSGLFGTLAEASHHLRDHLLAIDATHAEA